MKPYWDTFSYFFYLLSGEAGEVFGIERKWEAGMNLGAFVIFKSRGDFFRRRIS